MKYLFLVLMLVSQISFAQDHGAHHVKHNMILLGDEQIFASHIVYKVPHNYQVILQLSFSSVVKELYQTNKKAYPNDLFILLLDEMMISEIASYDSISGTLIREDAAGVRTEILREVKIQKGEFKIIYFDELPLSLAYTAV